MAVLLDGVAATFRADQNLQFAIPQDGVDQTLQRTVASELRAAVQTLAPRYGVFNQGSRLSGHA
jgi:hypothetical protein